MVVPDFDEVIKFHFPPPIDQFFDPYARDGKNREVPSLFPAPSPYKAEGKGVLGNLGGLAKLASTSLAEILGSSKEAAAQAPAPALRADKSAQIEEVKMLHAGTWHVETPQDIPNLEIPVMNYKSQWFGEEKMGGGWSSTASPLSDEWKHTPVSDRMQQLQTENPGMDMEEIMLQEGQMERFVDEDGQAHVVMKKGAAEAHTGERILRRTNPQLI